VQSGEGPTSQTDQTHKIVVLRLVL
jgi:hypothetical protein